MTWRYLPDLPPNTPDTWRVCDGFHPDRAGIYRTGFMAASFRDYGSQLGTAGLAYVNATGGPGMLVLAPNSGTSRAYVYNGSWNDRAGGAIFGNGSRSMAQYGNITLVANSAGIYQRDATGTSNFAAISGAPAVTLLLVTPLNIIMGFKALDQDGSISDAWYASDVGDYTNWSTGEAASGNLRQTPGGITSAVTFGNDVIAFKRRGVYRGQYVGGAVKWKWDLIDAAYGAWGAGCAVVAGGRVYFLGDDGLCSYDGSQFREHSYGINNALLGVASPGALLPDYCVSMVFDSISRKIFLFNFGSYTLFVPSGTRPSHLTYQVDSEAWGYQSRVKDEVDDSDDYSGVMEGFSTHNSVVNGAWQYNTNIALLSSTNTDIRVLTTEFSSANCGTNYKPTLRTYRAGTRADMTALNRFIPGWTLSEGAGTNLTGATVKTGTPYYSDAVIESETAGTAQTLSTDQYQVDFTRSARFQSVEIQLNCEACIDGGEFEGRTAGRR